MNFLPKPIVVFYSLFHSFLFYSIFYSRSVWIPLHWYLFGILSFVNIFIMVKATTFIIFLLYAVHCYNVTPIQFITTSNAIINQTENVQAKYLLWCQQVVGDSVILCCFSQFKFSKCLKASWSEARVPGSVVSSGLDTRLCHSAAWGRVSTQYLVAGIWLPISNH